MNQPDLSKSNLQLSRLGLGTVEIGVPAYGVGKEGLIDKAEAIKLLKTAVELGVTYIDTARGYGEAEERIGKSGITQREGVIVGTKCGQFLRDEKDLTGVELERRIREEIDTSRKLLRLDQLPLVQLHIELPDDPHLNELIEIMAKLKDEGKIEHVGIATRDEELPLAAIASGFFTTVQTAYSILDQRMAPRVLPAAKEAGVQILNRSVLLKGVLTPARENLPTELKPLKEKADQAQKIAQELGLDLPTLAIRFCTSNPAVSTILIGTTKPNRLESALTAIAAGPLPEDVLSELYKLAVDDPEQVDPSRWPKF